MIRLSFGLAAVAILASCSSSTKSTPFPTGEAIAVQVATPQSSAWQDTTDLTGVLATEQEVRYAFKIGGVVERIYVTEGQSFRKGQLLASLLLTEISKQQEQAQLGYDKAQRDLGRVQNLYADSVATLEQLQNAETGVRLAKKSAEIVAFNQQYARIYAPVDGFVTKRLASEGEIVAPGSPVLFANEVGATQGWVLRVGATDQVWAKTQTGQTARVELDAFPDTVFSAIVGRKSLVADPYSGSFQLELKLRASKLPLALGMFGRAQLQPSTASLNTLSIPYSALVEANGKNAFVFVASETKVRKVPVVISAFNQQEVQILAGLQTTDQVVVSNTAFLNEQSTITITR